MSVVVCRSSTPQFHVDRAVPTEFMPAKTGDAIWSMIQSQKPTADPEVAADAPPPPPYVHPLVRRSSGLMTQQSLEMCTEGLGSETGSDDFSDDDRGLFSSSSDVEEEEVNEVVEEMKTAKKELATVNYHSSTSRRSATLRSFPPPLPSIARRDGPCIQMRPHRQNGRLVVEAVPVASQNYIHARRHNGRLLLSFIDAAATFHQPSTTIINEAPTIEDEKPEQELLKDQQQEHAATEVKEQIEEIQESEQTNINQEAEVEDEEEEEEEVEVVDRGAMVEVKVTSQPQQPGGQMKILRSSLFINKFVGGTPLTNQNRWTEPAPACHLPGKENDNQSDNSVPLAVAAHRRPAPTTTTAAAAAVAASSASASSEMVGQRPDNKLLFTSKRRNREELLHHMRRCSELRRPLFFWEPGCIATST